MSADNKAVQKVVAWEDGIYALDSGFFSDSSDDTGQGLLGSDSIRRPHLLAATDRPEVPDSGQ